MKLARTTRYSLSSTLFALAALTPCLAHADDPKFDFGKKEEVKEVVWKASMQAGAIGATGNAQAITVNGGLSLSRNDGSNKVSFDAFGAYSQSWLRAAGPVDSNPLAGSDQAGRIDQSEVDAVNNRTAAKTPTIANWLAKLRYDRFFTERNAGYLTGFVGQDYVLTKSLITGGQLGYSRLLLKDDSNELAAEIGYDINYTRYSNDGVTDPAKLSNPVLLHSARLFLGYLRTFSKDTAFNLSVEAFVNFNSADIGPAGDANTHKGFAEASRVLGKAGVTTVIYKNISLKVGGTVRYDAAPAPVAVTLPKDGTGKDLPYAPGVSVLRLNNTDFIGEAAIVVTFL